MCTPYPANVSEFIVDPYCSNLTLAESPLAAQTTLPISLFLMAGTAISGKHRVGMPAANLTAAEVKYKDFALKRYNDLHSKVNRIGGTKMFIFSDYPEQIGGVGNLARLAAPAAGQVSRSHPAPLVTSPATHLHRYFAAPLVTSPVAPLSIVCWAFKIHR
jgi:hypothetical protein